MTVNGPINETITLKRPFAQINVGTEVGSLADAQTAEVWIKQSTFTIRNASKVLDTYSGAASTKDTDVQEVVYSLNDIIEDLTDVNDGKGDLLNVDDKDYEHLAMNYILVGDDAADTNTDDEYGVGENKQLVNTTFTIWGTQSATGTTVEKINEFEIPNVPVQRNWRTNIIGDILNETVTFNIVIDPEFDNDHNYYTEKEVAYAFASGGEVTLDKDVEITKPLYAYVGATDAETVKVITEKNIVVNLNGKTLTYTGDDIMARLGEGATVTFNGPGKVVASHYIASANAGGKIYVNGDAKDTEFTGKTCTLFQANGGEIYVSGGKFSNTYDATDTNKSTYLFNHIDAKKNNGLIEITGGTFVGYNPAASASENPVMNFVKYGYMAKETSVAGTYEVVENPLEKASINGENFTLNEPLTLNRTLTVAKDMTLELNGQTITNQAGNAETDVIVVKEGATLTINGTGTIEAVSGNDGYAVIADGKVIINGGTFKSGKDANDEPNAVVYARGNGKVYINGGTFPNENNSGFVLNKKDADRATTIIEVTGGTFTNFDPANNAAEGTGTNFVVDGYASTKVGDNYIVTVKQATAGETVTLSTDGIITNSIAVTGDPDVA